MSHNKTRFAENLTRIRREKNLSRKDVADFMRCHKTTIDRYEQGKREPDIATIKELAFLLECSVSELFEGEEKA